MNSNIKFIFYAGLGLLCLSTFSCKKLELAVPEPPNIINLTLTGVTLTDTLEFVKDGKVIGHTKSGRANQDVVTELVMVKGGSAEIQIRLKGHTEILGTRSIDGTAKRQELTYYFDGKKMYADFVSVKAKGFAQGDIEFVVDDKVVGSGNGKDFTEVNIGVDANQTRQLQVRKKGSTAVLLNREVKYGAASTPLVFYFDGEKIFDRIDAGLPANPANMLIIASFTNKVGVYRGPVDLIFYKGKLWDESYKTTATTMRIELPADGSFSKGIELPPLPETESLNKNVYTFRIVKRGTLDELPYDTTNEFQPIMPESGFEGQKIVFAPGANGIFVITDIKYTDDWDGTMIRPFSMDIASYFR